VALGTLDVSGNCLAYPALAELRDTHIIHLRAKVSSTAATDWVLITRAVHVAVSLW
jgi:hypothetical protein